MKTINFLVAMFTLLVAQATLAAEAGLFVHTPQRLSGSADRWSVSPDLAALARNPGSLTIDLDGKRFTATRSNDSKPGLWLGSVDAVRNLVVRHDGRHAHGFLYLGSRQYALRPAAGGGHELVDILDAQDFHDTVAPVRASDVAQPATAAVTNTGATVIDVLIVFTQTAVNGAGGSAAAQNLAQYAVDLQNMVITNSQIPDLTFRLAGVQTIDYAETGDSFADLDALRTNAQVSAQRDALGADIVVGIVESMGGSVVGRAYLQIDPGPHFADFAFAVLKRSAVETSLVFPHEVGHLFGMEHDPESPSNPPDDASFPWSFAQLQFVDAQHPEGFVTTMGNILSCGGSPPCYRLPYYSNASLSMPESPVYGRSLGVAGERENALTAFEVAPIVAAFRSLPDSVFASGFGD